MMQVASRMDRLGTESAFDVLARAQKLAASGRDIINLGIGQPDFLPAEHIIEAAIKALRDGYHGYTPANGLPQLREAVADDLGNRHGVKVNPDHVVIVPGGKPTMFFACLMLGEAGCEIIYPNPGFPIYESAIAFSGATPVPMALNEEDGFAFKADEVIAQITQRTRMIILNFPGNPTGGVVPTAELDKLVAGLEAFPHVAVLSDEIYSQMLYDGEEYVSLLTYPQIRDRLIVLDGWSKTYAMTGWRMGYGVWPESLVEKAIRLCINDHSCVNVAAQYAGLAALQGPQDHIATMLGAFNRRRKVIFERLNKIEGFTCTSPRGAFYAFPNIKGTGLSAVQLQDKLLEEAGVATIAGTSFGHLGEGFIRFSYANSEDNIEEAMERVSTLLR